MAESGPPLNVNDQQEPASQNKMFIVKILSEMRSNFNRASNDSTPPEPQPEPDQGLTQTPTPALDQDQESRRSFTNNEDSSSIIFEAQPVTEECEDEGQSVSKEPEEGTAVTECNEVEATGDISVENEPPEAMAVEETAPESDPKTVDKLEENGAMHEGPENGAMDKGPVPDKPDEVLQSDSPIVEDCKPDEPPCSTEQKPDDPEYTEDAPDSVAKETIPEHPSPTNVPIEEDVSNKQIGNKGNPSGSAEGNVEQMKRKPSVGQNSKNTLPKSLEESGEKRPRRSLRSAEKVPPAGSATRAPSAPAASRAKTARSAVPPEEDTSNSTGDEATSSQNSSRASKHGPAPEAPNDGTDMEDEASETSAKKARLARDSKIPNPAQEGSDDDRNGWRHASPFSALNSCPTDKAARQAADNCVLLLLARGARTELVNKAGQTPRDCVINKDSYCYTAIDLNITIKKTVASTSFFPKILCNDVSGGREENPIQCVNGVDDDGVPVDYTYITENCFTSNITIDRRISSLV
ncbi:unnamed protein product, partial [Nesidiocoris tenuis]